MSYTLMSNSTMYKINVDVLTEKLHLKVVCQVENPMGCGTGMISEELTAQTKHRGLIIIFIDLFVVCYPPILMLSAQTREVNKVLIPEINFLKVFIALLDCLHGLFCLSYFPCFSDYILPRKWKIGNYVAV